MTSQEPFAANQGMVTEFGGIDLLLLTFGYGSFVMDLLLLAFCYGLYLARCHDALGCDKQASHR
jgi:hypothetical protein